MKLAEIKNSITDLGGVGTETAKYFANLGIFCVGELLSHFPRDWEDRTRIVPLAEFQNFPKVHTVAKVVGHDWFGYGRMKTLKIIIDDTTAIGELTCFNRPFLQKTCPIGSLIAVTGSFFYKYGSIQCGSFEVSVLSKDGEIDPFMFKQNSRSHIIPGSGVLPIYGLTAGLSQKILRKSIAGALKAYYSVIDDEVSESVREKHRLLHKRDAVQLIHQPKSLEDVEKARNTLIFEELFLFQTELARRSLERRGFLPHEYSSLDEDLAENLHINVDEGEFSDEEFEKSLSPSQKKLFKTLPFKLTKDQKKVIYEIHMDFCKSETSDFIMSRLLQGDVGSGKTLVAFFACLEIIDRGFQCAFLSPTELLARQHGENAAKLFAALDIKLAFLTGNLKAAGRGNLLKALKAGEIDLVIGTHALFSQSTTYKNLGLVIIDEQHRFGVAQRNAMLSKSVNRNLLMMSATPIPQTLALTIFSDMDISVIHSMPAGRLPVKTHLAEEGNVRKVYDFVRRELNEGHQAYFVYPLIADSDEGKLADLKSAEQMYKELSKEFAQQRVALIHSEIDEEAQKNIMRDFRENKIQILVATSVIEVGVDVPNATCMVIEHSERFGLAALHQLRGRVGRSDLQSHCFLVYDTRLTEIAKQRLKVLFQSNDGFFVAEKDLILRGPGEVLGLQQSGYMNFTIADPVRDKDIMLLARKAALENLQSSELQIS